MSRTVNDVIAELGEFMAVDDECEDVGRLYVITDGLPGMSSASAALPALFGVLERHPHCDLGSPGPIVHAIEAIGGHVPGLVASLRCIPVPLTVEMVNRLPNSDLEDAVREALIHELRGVAEDEAVGDSVRDVAKYSLDFQRR